MKPSPRAVKLAEGTWYRPEDVELFLQITLVPAITHEELIAIASRAGFTAAQCWQLIALCEAPLTPEELRKGLRG